MFAQSRWTKETNAQLREYPKYFFKNWIVSGKQFHCGNESIRKYCLVAKILLQMLSSHEFAVLSLTIKSITI